MFPPRICCSLMKHCQLSIIVNFIWIFVLIEETKSNWKCISWPIWYFTDKVIVMLLRGIYLFIFIHLPHILRLRFFVLSVFFCHEHWAHSELDELRDIVQNGKNKRVVGPLVHNNLAFSISDIFVPFVYVQWSSFNAYAHV